MTFAGGKGCFTAPEVRLARPFEGRWTIRSNEGGRMFLGFVGSETEGVGDSRFDARDVVTSSPESLTARVFSPDRREELIRTVLLMDGAPGYSLRLEPERLILQVSECLRDSLQVLRLRRTLEEFLGSVMSMPDPGIQWGERVEPSTGRCPICVAPLRDPIVRCRRCASPHPQDCWEYLGRCATYVCDPKGRRTAA